ncbi:MAG TPA: ribonuclease R, partial [Bdellovibrionota bacterium]|nr:ribonuclease R [Bdellovibrionota bacterium]
FKKKRKPASRGSAEIIQRAGGSPHAPRPAKLQIRDRSGKVHSLGSGGGQIEVDQMPVTPWEKPRQEKRSAPTRRRPEKKHAFHGKQKHQGEEFPTALRAVVDKNRKGFGFLIFDSRDYEDAFIPPNEAERLFHGDRVEVRLSHRGEVQQIKVLEHRFRELTGKFLPHPNGKRHGGWVVYERKRAREEVFCPKLPATVEPDDWVRASLHFHEDGPFPVTAEIIEVYGPVLPPSADVAMIAAEYNLVEEHSDAAEAEARSIGSTVDEAAIRGRTDLRHVPFITIDGETARDFDDAVYVERERSGYVLWVAIADVSHYVTDGTPLDKDARSRGTSVYFPERAFHMLPRALSENLCSLKPGVPRLALAARMVYDREGRRTSTEILDCVIQSRRRATYNEIQDEWQKNGKDPGWEYAPHAELYSLIRKARSARGSIDFDLPEAEIRVKPTGEVEYIRQRERNDAHRLIEEFMISANEAVTEWMMERSWPFVYRVHEEPSAEALTKFQSLAATVGVRLVLEVGAPPKILADLVRTLEGHPAQTLLNTALLRSMRQAVYTSVHGIHYGLASQAYTHFTSPIRRYPDLVVHRLIRRALRTESGQEAALKPQGRAALEDELTDVTEHCSYRERLAAEAERESNKLKQVRAMMEHLGDEFEGRIIGMIDSGFFVTIPEPYVEGMVPKESITDDFYEFNADRMVFHGRRKKRMFKVGDAVKVIVVRADLDRRQIDFGLSGMETDLRRR